MTPSNETNDLRDASDAHLGGGPDRPAAGAQPSWLGKRVGRFKLLGLLGQGAMGRVFRVEDTLLQRYAALKVLPRTIQRGGKAVAVERLIREARAAATVEHPNAVTIFEVNESGGVHYIAMELIEGGTLRDLVKASGSLEYPRACLLCADAAVRQMVQRGHAPDKRVGRLVGEIAGDAENRHAGTRIFGLIASLALTCT